MMGTQARRTEDDPVAWDGKGLGYEPGTRGEEERPCAQLAHKIVAALPSRRGGTKAGSIAENIEPHLVQPASF